MAEIKKNFISLVALGGLNPQILNVDFLKKNQIVPIDKPPFDKLFKQQPPFTKFISTPVVSELVLENIHFIIEEGRFQIRDDAVSEWTETKIFDIAKKYFGILPFTPLKVVGLNLNLTVAFKTVQEANRFQQIFLPEKSEILDIISQKNAVAELVLHYPSLDKSGRITLSLGQQNITNIARMLNFNYEFDFVDWKHFENQLNKVPEITKYFDYILGQLLKVI